MASGRSEDYKTKIRRWFLEEGWSLDDSKSAPGYAWCIQVDRQGNPPYMFFSFRAQSEVLSIFSVFHLDDASINHWTRLTAQERSDFLVELKLQLLARPYSFSLEPDQLKITIEERIFPDGFSKDSVFQRFAVVHGGLLYAALLCLRRLGLADQGFDLSPVFVN